MKFIRKKTTLKFISFIWLMGILSSCGSYYKLNHLNHDFERKIEREMMKGTSIYFVHSKNEIFQITAPRIESNVIIGEITPSNSSELSFYYQMTKSYTKKKRFSPKSVKEARRKYHAENMRIDSLEMKVSDEIHQVHIHTDNYTKSGQELTVKVSDMYMMQIFQKTLDPGLVFIISVFGILIFSIIALAIACNCPHVYMDNGDKLEFTNTLFTGSVSSPLERFDFKTLPDFHPNNSDINLQIRNENQEIQWTNYLGLTVAYHDPSVQVIPDLRGNLHTIQDTKHAKNYCAHDGTNLKNELIKDDHSYFSFDRPTKNGLVTANMQFDKPQELDHAKLILNVKNTEWAGFIHQQFIESMGARHEGWLTRNQNKSQKEQLAALKRAGIPLVVSIKKNNKWIELEQVLAIGNANDQSIVIPIKPELLSDPSIEIRVESGFNLWQMDYVAMDFSKPAAIEIQHLSPSDVSGATSNLGALLKNDASYMVSKEGSEPIDVRFDGLYTSKSSRTLILESKGYYVHQGNQKGKTNWLELVQLASKHGVGKFSQNKFAYTLPLLKQISSISK
jgi:hypothetical protein